ncbi:MAG: DHH family phosphoesterase [Flavobacteriales bacterium]|nr:DHH family phosphoesterase [Flavobacteriales bacterium]
MSKTDFTELKELLSTPKKIAIVAHKSPDGDAIGSSLGLYHYLTWKSHNVEVIMPNDYPTFLKWMPGNDKIVIHEGNEKNAEALINEAEVLFCLDFNTPSRAFGLEDVLRNSDNVKVMIDHHPQPDGFVDFMLSDTSSCSTAQLIHRFAAMMGDKIPNKESGECLYCGIMTDSGGFRFPSVTSETHRIVADLLDLGVKHDEVYNLVNSASSEHRLRLLGYCIDDKLEVLPKYGTAFISLSMEEKKRFHFQSGDTEGTVNYPLSIEGVHFSAIFIEAEDIVKISFRSIGDFDVNQFSRDNFEGGGHRNAAGGKSDFSLQETIEKFVALLPKYADKLKA